ncbi:TPR and ankyrin repeat-containing protein 1-like [Prunus dulcis]|uniref:TPR and ankyrin repeat-containing protein 1-like n=1 Tax=Prunus dulcis TaxID=3755 RepID=UPI001482485F|nr:TPR and ankyrin repeat-containing protein 1-like [Prunus dulcis]
MVEGLYIVCTTDIAKDVKYIQILKIWDLLALEDIPKLADRLESILKRYTDDFINRCKEKCHEGDLEIPKSWLPSLDIVRFKDLSITENQSDLVGDNDSDDRSYVENSQVSESLLLMKFYSLSSGVVNHLGFACGGSDSTDKSLIDMADFDEEEAQFKDIKDSFHDISPNSYPLVITFHKFLMMLDGTLGNSYFERFLDATKLTHTLTKKLDASRVFTEIISHIKGGLGAMEAGDGKLNRDDYVQLSEGRVSNLSKQKREAIYDIFQAYEKMKMENGEFDLGDFVIDLHRRLMHEKYGGDLTVSQFALFKHMCINNTEEGFIFSGDTAQTIARGIDFRFQDLRHLFHKKFVSESRSNKLEERKEKGKLSKIFHLTQNFRTHADPETSLIYGEAPVLLEYGENENPIIKIFGNSATGSGNIVGFGAEQVILVRDDGTKKDVSTFVGKHALVLTIVECKGLEFQL